MRRHFLFLALIAAVTASVLFVWRSSSGAPQRSDNGQAASERRSGNSLPLGHIVLFNSGVGYFQREGTIDGDARVDLQFPAGDVNDLLKSLVLHDQGQGKVTAISYDGQEPVERTLKTFAIDLTGNPTFGQLLNQARGEKIEATLQNTKGGGTSTLTGTIMGMEAQTEPGPREVHLLNLLCAEGMRNVPLNTVQRVRFLNAVLDSELRRALDVLANAHNSMKKNVSVQFSGEGKRTVKVGYVVEAPMWKSSYRLVLDKAGKATLQGWAIIENTTDEDWKDVRLALVASRPISFQMDLYPPLFVPRPVVEPERFASLRPTEYQGPLTNSVGNLGVQGGMGLGGMGGIGGIAGLGGGGFNQQGQAANSQGGRGGVVGFGGQQLGFQGGFHGASNRYQLSNNMGQGLGLNRLSYQELQQRRQERAQAREEAKQKGSAIDAAVEFDPISGVNVSTLTETVGDQARFLIDHKISLARQRSALLPLVNQEIAGQRVSIFNAKVNSKFPLLGLKIKNATGRNLMQGPVSVYENGSYAGDARLPDLQANEERLLSFAVDQAVEIKSESSSQPDSLTVLRIVKGVLEETHRQRSAVKYLIQNRSGQERTLIVEHPINPDWKLVGAEKPAERTRDMYRFQWQVPSGKGQVREVVEERTYRSRLALLDVNSSRIELLIRSNAASPKLRDELQKIIESKSRRSETQKELGRLRDQFADVTKEQNRVHTSLGNVPPGTNVHKRYLEKLDKLETDIETLQKQIKDTQEKEKKQDAELTKYLAELTVE